MHSFRVLTQVLLSFLLQPKWQLDAARAAAQLSDWSDLENNISDDEDTIESEDSEDEIDQPTPEERDDATHESMDDPPAVNNQNSLTSLEKELTDSSTGESDREDSTGSRLNDLMAKSSFKERNRRVWATMCPPPSRTRACNLRHTTEGLVGAAKDIHDEVKVFACFIDEDMLKQVVKHTNTRARRDLRAKGKNPDEWVPVNLREMRGIFGLLYLIGVYRSQHESLPLLWSSCPSGRAIFPALFGRNRFEQVIANLRFDSREDRNTEDKFATFRQTET